MRLIGHRGCPAYAPENTIEAVELAVPHVDAVEVDVQRCGTGELVVFHDTTLDRLTAASGPVAATDFDTLSSLSIGESDSTIPTLAELLSSVPPSVGVNVELKHAGMATDLQAIL
ncbi:MAG: glycerophosphodiester phosphodiesterase, partial [Halobacteriota archaeon]